MWHSQRNAEWPDRLGSTMGGPGARFGYLAQRGETDCRAVRAERLEARACIDADPALATRLVETYRPTSLMKL
jgi:hypothetical protein